MLKIRVLTAAVLGPLFVLGILYLPPTYFALLIAVVILLGAWEWTALSGLHEVRLQAAAVVATTGLMAAAYGYRQSAAEPLFGLACVGWLVVSALLFRRRHGSLLEWPPALRWACGAGVLVPAWLALCVLQAAEPAAALLLVALIWAADTAAYFAGRRWGRHKLAPAISPGKSVEGVWGGALAGGLVAVLFGLLGTFDAMKLLLLVTGSIVVVLVSVFGDLFESNWKRLANLKDSSGIVPGHGGVLDRIDSMTAAAPFYALGWTWWFGSGPA